MPLVIYIFWQIVTLDLFRQSMKCSTTLRMLMKLKHKQGSESHQSP
ncbi:hypothetical protein [Vibrio alginolyticus]